MLCNCCPRRCNAERTENSPSSGFCRMPYNAVLARAGLHRWEEPPISGENGSGAIFFSGCSLRCVFCQNFEISRGDFGKPVSEARFIEIMKKLEASGAHNINLVSPTHFVPFIRGALMKYKPSVPVVYNTGGYDTVGSLRTLEGLVDVYLPDLKFYDADISRRYAAAGDYFECAGAAVLEMRRQTGGDVFRDGLLKRGLLIRHLVLPGNVGQTVRILEWIARSLPKTTYVSLMRQYTPCGRAEDFRELSRCLTTAEYDRAVEKFFALGLKNGYMQERSSAGEDFIPAFDLTGL